MIGATHIGDRSTAAQTAIRPGDPSGAARERSTATETAIRPGEAAGAPEAREVALPWHALHLRRRGRGEPLLYLHGTHLAGLWLPLHERLAGAGHDVLVPTHPGFREGQPPAWLQGLDDLVLLYRGLLDALGLRRVHVAGHALGGWLAAQFAILCPERTASLALISPFGLRVPGHGLADFLVAPPGRVPELLFSGDPGPHAAVLPDPDDPAAFARAYGEHGVTARLMWERRYDLALERRLPLVAAPALVLQPDDDRIVPPQHAARWSELLPHARLRTLPGPHALPLTDPDGVAAAIATLTHDRAAAEAAP